MTNINIVDHNWKEATIKEIFDYYYNKLNEAKYNAPGKTKDDIKGIRSRMFHIDIEDSKTRTEDSINKLITHINWCFKGDYNKINYITTNN